MNSAADGNVRASSSCARRRAVAVVAAIALELLWFRRFVAEGYVVPLRVEGASMAPYLLGQHHEVICAECRFAFVVDTQPPLRANFIRCQNCKGIAAAWPPTIPRPGDRLVIRKWWSHARPPQRWDVVAVVLPEQDKHVVKRIVGLPGELVEIRFGDLRIDRRLIDRPQGVTEAVAAVVNDDRFRPVRQGKSVSSWRPDRPGSSWNQTQHGFAWAAAKPSHEIDWLTYRHTNVVTDGTDVACEGHVTDDSSYNQSISRPLHEVRDLSLSGRLTLDANTEMLVKQQLGEDQLSWQFDAEDGQLALLIGGQQRAKTAFQTRDVTFCLGLWDGHLRLLLNGETKLSYFIGERTCQGTSRPFSIGVRCGTVRIADLVVRRDSYLTLDSPRPSAGRWKLGPNEYFLLGDNSPVSEDSRHWPFVVQREHVVGRVVR